MIFTRLIYPLTLREKISYRVQKFYTAIKDKQIPLAFNKNIKLDLVHTDIAHRSIIFNGFYELGLSKIISKLGAKGGVLIDVGANYGYFSCLWASKNPSNYVYAFEASPANIKPLVINVNQNSLNSQIKVEPVALGKEKGTINFITKSESRQTGWGGFAAASDSDYIEVEVNTLDEYAQKNNIGSIDVLKIDTEGADTWVLYGAKKLLENKQIKNIYYEHNKKRMELLEIDKNEAQDFLTAVGYQVCALSPTDFYAFPKI